jgi:large conductance mechanosensitive channel
MLNERYGDDSCENENGYYHGYVFVHLGRLGVSHSLSIGPEKSGSCYNPPMGNFWSEFRAFAVKGNVFDLAIAVVIGNAFSGVVNALVGDIITPLVGLLTGNIDLKNLALTLHPAVGNLPALTLKYGDLAQAIMNFLVISLSIFFVFKGITAMRKTLFKNEKKTPPEQKPAQERLLEEIRDLLKEQKRV